MHTQARDAEVGGHFHPSIDGVDLAADGNVSASSDDVDGVVEVFLIQLHIVNWKERMSTAFEGLANACLIYKIETSQLHHFHFRSLTCPST